MLPPEDSSLTGDGPAAHVDLVPLPADLYFRKVHYALDSSAATLGGVSGPFSSLLDMEINMAFLPLPQQLEQGNSQEVKENYYM
ncbi:hypothetical protein LEMLEM_LOCUS24434 [Lemmus lemmus]